MGLFTKLKPPHQQSNNANGSKEKSSNTPLKNQPKDWVPSAIEFTTSDGGDAGDDSTFDTPPAAPLMNGGVAGGVVPMMGHGMNSRRVPPSAPGLQQQQLPESPGGWKKSEMVGRGMNSRQVAAPPQKNPFHSESSDDDDDGDNVAPTHKKKQPPNPFMDDSTESPDQQHTQSTKKGKSKQQQQASQQKIQPPIAGIPPQAPLAGGLQQFEDSMKQFEEKLGAIDNSKFMEFDNTGGSSHSTPLSEIEEEAFGESESESGNGNFGIAKNYNSSNTSRGMLKKKEKKKSGLKKFFGKKKKQQQTKGNRRGSATKQQRVHRPAVDSASEGDYDDDEYCHREPPSPGETNSDYISGEYDEEFDNSEGFIPTESAGPNSRSAAIMHQRQQHHQATTTTTRTPANTAANSRKANPNSGGGIGVPNPNTAGGVLSASQLEDELYLYKLETLNLTDACRDLAEQLDEVESKLENVQAQATFRIHALESELQDGNLGLKSLVKMTSAEMDGRLDALRALGKTATIQASKLKERDSELILVEQRLRKTRRDVKSLRRENKMVVDERSYLKGRLNELELLKVGLEEDLQVLATENTDAANALTREEQAKFEETKLKFEDTLLEIGELKIEILEMKEELDRKEHDLIRVEIQLDKVRKDLLDAATAANSAEEARVDAEHRELTLRSDLEDTVGLLEECTTKVAILESTETQLKLEMENATLSKEEEAHFEEQRARLGKLEGEVEMLREEKAAALDAINEAQAGYAKSISERESQIDTLNKDVEVHQEQMELAQTMLEEKEMLSSELRNQLEDAMKDEEMRVSELEESLAAKSREVNNVIIELEERNKDVDILEEKLEKARKEFMEHSAEADAAAVAAAEADGLAARKVSVAASKESSETDIEKEDEEVVVESSSAIPSAGVVAVSVHVAELAKQNAKLAEKETQIERMERELGTSKRQLDATRIELDEKDKHAERIKLELERLKNEKNTKIEELEGQLGEKSKNFTDLRKQLDEEKLSLNVVVDKLTKLQIDLESAVEATHLAEDARTHAEEEVAASQSAEQATHSKSEILKSQMKMLQMANEDVVGEVKKLKDGAEKEKKSSAQSAATLATTNAARQAEMEMRIAKMHKEIEFRKREIDAIKSELREKAQTANRLNNDLLEAKDDFASYKAKIESEKEKVETEKDDDALQRVAEMDYFDGDDILSVTSNSEHTFSTAGGSKGSSRSMGLLGGLFSRSANDIDGNVDWEKEAREKDARIEQLQNTLADNSLSTNNLKNELITASSKFKEDESQRRLLIQALENENQAYSIKLEVLESEFEEIRRRKEAVAIGKASNSNSFDDGSDGSVASSVSNANSTGTSTINSTGSSRLTGVSSITGMSRLNPMERDNKKLKKQKKVYESRIASLQTQLSEIQQIVPELMSKSKSQILKLENAIDTHRNETERKEDKYEVEIKELKERNEQLQAATRSVLQSSDVDKQDEIDQLTMRLEAREATISKLEMLAGTGSLRVRGGKILRKKRRKKKKADGDIKEGDEDGEVSVLSGDESSWGTAHQSMGYSVTNDAVFS